MIVVLFDTETTGLLAPSAQGIAAQPYITDIFCLKVRHDSINDIFEVDRFESLIKPPIPLTAEITKITGLTDADLRDQPTFKDIWEDLANFFMGTNRVVAHNLGFDRSMLANELTRCGKVINFPWPIDHCCTVEQSLHIEQRRMSLQRLHEHYFDKGFEGAHRAKADVEALFRCYKAMAKDALV